jgi:hypothetical protein
MSLLFICVGVFWETVVESSTRTHLTAEPNGERMQGVVQLAVLASGAPHAPSPRAFVEEFEVKGATDHTFGGLK